MARSRGRRARWRTPGSNVVAQAVSARRERDQPARQAAIAASAGVTEKFTMLRQIARNDGGRGEEGGGSGRRSEPEEMVETPEPLLASPSASASVRPSAGRGRIPSLSPKSRERSLGLNIMKLRNSVAVLPVFFHGYELLSWARNSNESLSSAAKHKMQGGFRDSLGQGTVQS